MPWYNRVVDRIPISREALSGRGNLTAILLASLATSVPITSLHALHLRQTAKGLESSGADKFDLSSGWMKWLLAFHLLSVVSAQGLGGVAIEFPRGAAVFYRKERTPYETINLP